MQYSAKALKWQIQAKPSYIATRNLDTASFIQSLHYRLAENYKHLANYIGEKPLHLRAYKLTHKKEKDISLSYGAQL